MKQKYIATIGALALTLPALAAAQTPGTQQDRDTRAEQPAQQHEPGSAERGTMQERDRDYGKTHPGTAQPGEGRADQQRGAPTAEGRPGTQPGTAQERDYQRDDRAHQPGVAGAHDRKFKLDNLTGKDVTDQQGEQIGSVEDFLISADGRIVSVLVSTGGVMGIGGETKAVEWDRFDVQKDQDGTIQDLRTTMSKQELENLPEYEEDEGLFD